jgi:hypothetical protein
VPEPLRHLWIEATQFDEVLLTDTPPKLFAVGGQAARVVDMAAAARSTRTGRTEERIL